MKTNLLFLHALSPLHAGTGQGVGSIDLPIAREKATNLPIVPGSTLKGILRANCEDDGNKICERVFGAENIEFAGSAQFSDLRLLFLPVRSLAGTFAWVTSPLILRRFARDCQMAEHPLVGKVPVLPDFKDEECFLPSLEKSALKMQTAQSQVILEDLPLTGKAEPKLAEFADELGKHLFPDDRQKDWQALFAGRVCVVHDDVLGFLLDTATEITARIQLKGEKKTVKEGALWYEEALPAESILAGLMVTQKVRADETEVLATIEKITQSPLQVGGNSTVGRGLCRVRLV